MLPTFGVRTITPEEAAELLTRCHPDNRTISGTRVRYLVDIINQGDFRLTNDMVCLDINGLVINGQHRLKACVVSGKPITVVFGTGYESKAMIDMDSGQHRTIDDSLRAAGVSNAEASRAKPIRYFAISTNFHQILSPNDAIRVAKDFEEEISFSCEHVPMSARAPIKGLAARAYRHYKSEAPKLARFFDVVFAEEVDFASFGICEEDSAALAYRDYLRNIKKLRRGGGGSVNRDIYLKGESAVKIFMEGRQVKKIRKASKELFPVTNCPVTTRHCVVNWV
jgi:hypothetical protein